MFASLLPGIREIRAPLAAGYVWLAFAYLVADAPVDVSASLGPFSELATRIGGLGTVAVASVLSFGAYLVGGVSTDLFGRFLPRAVEPLAYALSSVSWGAGPYAPTTLLSRIQVSATQLTDTIRSGDVDATADLHELRDRVAVARDALLEANRAGASETELPQGERAMLEAQEGLLLAIMPPIAAIAIFLGATESPLWLLGVVAPAIFFVQAALRQAAWRRLAREHGRAAQVDVLAQELADALRDFDRGNNSAALRTLNAMDLTTLQLSGGRRRR